MELSAVWNFLSLTKNTRTFYRCKTSTVFLQQFFQRRKRARKQVLTTPTKNSLYSILSFRRIFPLFLGKPNCISSLRDNWGSQKEFWHQVPFSIPIYLWHSHFKGRPLKERPFFLSLSFPQVFKVEFRRENYGEEEDGELCISKRFEIERKPFSVSVVF